MKRRPRSIKCRHCLLLYAGACPYPGARSVHRMHISSGACRLATLHPMFRRYYPGRMERGATITQVSKGGRRAV